MTESVLPWEKRRARLEIVPLFFSFLAFKKKKTCLYSLFQTAQRPEIRIVTIRNEEISSDALTLHGYEHFQAKDYRLGLSPSFMMNTRIRAHSCTFFL